MSTNGYSVRCPRNASRNAWTVVDIPVPEESVSEAVAEAVKAAGAHGVAEEWRAGRTFVRAFWLDVSEGAAAETVRNALRLLVEVGLLESVPTLSVSVMSDEDWLEGWKQHFSPIEVSPRLAITPSWESLALKPGQAAVTIDPGMAFGTGAHGTTLGCLRALSDHLTPGMAVCDVGAGSGILAIAAVKLGAALVVATDCDELAIRVARENAEQNDVAGHIEFRAADLLEGVDGPFHLVVANILAPVIIRLLPELPRVLLPGGAFISSGYIDTQEGEVRAALAAAGHAVVSRYEDRGWITLVSRSCPTAPARVSSSEGESAQRGT